MISYKTKVAITYILGFSINLLSVYIAVIAFPVMGRELHASVTELAWIANIYALGLALIIPLSGWLGDKYGTKKIFILSLLMFLIAVTMCGFSTSIGQLIFWRLIQGLGGGLLMPVGQTMAYRIFPKQERAKLTAMVMAAALMAPALSPTIGGWIIQYFTWHWIFFLNIPFVIIAILLAFFWLREEIIGVDGSLDFIGIFLMSIGVSALLYGLSSFKTITDLYHSLGYIIGGGVALLIFTLYALRAKHPIVDIGIIKDKLLSRSMILFIFVVGGFAGINIVSIFFFQSALGLSPVRTGTLMIPYCIGAFFAVNIAGKFFNKMGPKMIMLVGLALFSFSIFLLTLINSSDQFNYALMIYFLIGFGGSLCSASAQTLALLEIHHEHMGRASTLWNLNRQLCLSFGGAIFPMLLTFLLYNKNIPNMEHVLHNMVAISAFHISFIIAASLCIIPFFLILKLDNQKILRALQT